MGSWCRQVVHKRQRPHRPQNQLRTPTHQVEVWSREPISVYDRPRVCKSSAGWAGAVHTVVSQPFSISSGSYVFVFNSYFWGEGFFFLLFLLFVFTSQSKASFPPFCSSSSPPITHSTLPPFLFRYRQASHGYQPTTAYQVAARLGASKAIP